MTIYWSQEGDSISLAQPDYSRANSQATPDYDSIASFSQPYFIQKSNPKDTRNNRKHHNNSTLHKANRKLLHMKVEEIVEEAVRDMEQLIQLSSSTFGHTCYISRNIVRKTYNYEDGVN